MSSSHWRSYIVGGAVRDRLLGQPVQDRDWVVVGASVEDMLAAGFTPVGKDFPVFLHPRTHEEYALARTERKTAPGYKGFVFHADSDVKLEDDLIRRDLTINAMAEDADGNLIDPYGGQRDLAARVFRHVSRAFAEDPVRILRLARFAARYPEFSVAPETMLLMRDMVSAGEVDHLVAERVWQEISRGLMYVQPSRMFAVLRACGALARILPELDALFGVSQQTEAGLPDEVGAHALWRADRAAARAQPLAVRWAAVVHDLGKGQTDRAAWPQHPDHETHGLPLVEAVCERLRVPVDCRDLAIMATREHARIQQLAGLDAESITVLLERCDVLRRPARFESLLAEVACDCHDAPGSGADECGLTPRWLALMQAVCGVDAAAIAASQSDKRQISTRLHAARVEVVQKVLDRWNAARSDGRQ